MKIRMHLAILSVPLSLLFACALVPRYHVDVSGYARGDFSTLRYWLLPAEKDVHPNDLEFEEYARYVEYALGKQGYQKANSADDAGVVIYLTYGIGNPEKNEYTITLPVYGQTGVSSSTTTGTINSYGNWGTYTGTTTYTPSYGVTGYQNVQGSYVTYFRYLSLSAVDLQEYRNSGDIVELSGK